MKDYAQCWACQHHTGLMQGIGEGEGKPPQGGDFALCYDCGEWSVFTDDLDIRQPTDAEYDELVGNPDSTTVRNGWLTAKRARDEGREVSGDYLIELVERIGETRVFERMREKGWGDPTTPPPLREWNNAVVELMLEDERRAARDGTS
jgi:hypothetical protein